MNQDELDRKFEKAFSQARNLQEEMHLGKELASCISSNLGCTPTLIY